MENGHINAGFRTSQIHLNENTGNGEVFSINSEISNSTDSPSAASNSSQKKPIRKGGLSDDGTHVEEGRIQSLELPSGKKGFLGDIGFSFSGAEFNDSMDPDEWKPTPILVESVTRGSIAEKAGLEPGDEILKINGITVARAAQSLPVCLIRKSHKKMLMVVKKGKGSNRSENIVFSKEQIQEFYDAFCLSDSSDKRKILVKDVHHVCRALGYNETALELDDAISAARTKTGELADGEKIHWNTFLEIMKEIMKHRDVEKDFLTAYAVFDPARKGHFSILELQKAFLMGARASPEELSEIFTMADPDCDGQVREEEFVNLLHPLMEMY